MVDDEVPILQLSDRILTRAGHQVQAASDPREGLELFRARAGEFDLVVLDVLMPGMTGWAVAREIRRLRPAVPILFCSGYATEEVEREIAGLDRSRLLGKPFTPAELLTEVGHLAGLAAGK